MASHLTLRLRHGLAVLAVLAWAIALTVTPALAADVKVGLVVVYGNGKVQTVVVSIPEGGTTADALKASGLPVVIAETSFGPALCKIGDDGCPADDCFCNKEKSWAYWHLGGNTWKAAEGGVGGFKPVANAVEGFTWTAYDAQFTPLVKPPVVSFADVEAGKAPATIPVTGALGIDDLARVRAAAGILGILSLAGYLALRRQARAA
ncbi:MAG: hypothetical protein IT330_04730 [Anaerolineae bacterium]|nr:hypothetical protein [Anaerolineae bacterium]